MELLRDEGVIDPTAPQQIVDAFEGLSLTLRELQARIQTVADLEDLARRLKPDAYAYRWELILAPFLARAGADELVASAAAIPHNDYAWRGLTAIAERLIGLRDDRAKAIVDRLVRTSRPVGWSPRYDGGSRLVAYELLVRVSPETGRLAAWEALRQDLAAGEVGLMSLFAEWQRVVALLAPDTSSVDLWNVVSDYVAALVAYAPRGEVAVLPPPEDASDPAAAREAVTCLVADYLDHPALTLAHGARQFFVDRLLAGDGVAEAVLSRRLADSATRNTGGLLVLEAVLRAQGDVPAGIREALRALQHLPHYSDRRAAMALIAAVTDGESDVVARPAIQRPLPAVFQIVHPPVRPTQRRPLPGRGAMLEPAQDAADLVSILRPELDLIARWADVQPEALYHHVAERAAASLPDRSREYGLDDEPALRDELHRLGLEITYRRPRPRQIEYAMTEATALLLDNGRIGERYLPALDRLFRNADPYFLVVRPTRRPSAVHPIPERKDSQYVASDWTARVTAEVAATGRIVTAPESQVRDNTPRGVRPDGPESSAEASSPASGSECPYWIVLAEETWVRWLDWKLATETRVGARLEPRVWASIDPHQDAEKFHESEDTDGDTTAGQALDARVADCSGIG